MQNQFRMAVFHKSGRYYYYQNFANTIQKLKSEIRNQIYLRSLKIELWAK